MKHALFAILFFCPLFAFGDTNDEMAIRDLERAIQMTDATMEHSFSGSTSNMRMYDLYNLETQQGSGTADVWPYTAAIEAHCSVIEALDMLQEKAPQLYNDNRERYVKRLKQLFNSLDYYRGTYTLNSYARISQWSIYGVHRSNTKGTAAVTGIENVYDDQMWICREMVRAYKLTGDNDYLTKAAVSMPMEKSTAAFRGDRATIRSTPARTVLSSNLWYGWQRYTRPTMKKPICATSTSCPTALVPVRCAAIARSILRWHARSMLGRRRNCSTDRRVCIGICSVHRVKSNTWAKDETNTATMLITEVLLGQPTPITRAPCLPVLPNFTA